MFSHLSKAMPFILGLKPKTDGIKNSKKLKGIIFDMDGTLTQPQAWMFVEMRQALKTPTGVDLLDFVKELPDEESCIGFATYDPATHIVFDDAPKTKQEAERRLQYIETKAMIQQKPTLGVKTTLKSLMDAGVQLGICTRNVRTPVDHFLENVLNSDNHNDPISFTKSDSDSDSYPDPELTSDIFFKWVGPIVTRDFQPPKPSPEPLLHIIERFNDGRMGDDLISADEVLMVGDSIDDMEAGRRAGCGLVLINHGQHGNDKVAKSLEIDLIVKDMTTLFEHLENGLEIKSVERF